MSAPLWTDARLATLRAILGRHRSVNEAAAEASRVLGFSVSRDSAKNALRKAGFRSPSAYLSQIPPVQFRDTQRMQSAPPVEFPDDSETTIPESTRHVPSYGPPVDIVDDMGRNSPERDAANRGWAPSCDWTHRVPEGHRVKGNSTLYGADGSVEGQWVKSERDSDDPPAHAVVPAGHLVKKVSSLLDGQGKVRAQWVQAPKDEQTRWDEFWAACERNVERYRGLAEPAPARDVADTETCTVYPLGDPHIGMLAWSKETGQDFDLDIAERDLRRAVDLLVDRAPPSHKAILANVGDFFHAEGDEQRTPTGGNKLDCDTRWAKIADVGLSIMRHLVDRLLERHAFVHVVNVPGNHDPKMARMMNMWLAAVYEREPRVKVEDNRNPYIYIRHGKNLLGFAHGDGAKPEQLPSVMAADRASDWGATEYRVWFTGHIHHQTRKEFPGCVVESFRTLASRDYWHSWKGYRSGQSLSCITLHEEYGELARSTVDIKLVRAAATP